MKRPVARKRQLDRMKRRRKVEFMKNAWHISDELLEDPRFVGKLTKGKVHCSCPMCAAKTNLKSGVITSGWTHSDKKKLEKISNQLIEEYDIAYQTLSKNDENNS